MARHSIDLDRWNQFRVSTSRKVLTQAVGQSLLPTIVYLMPPGVFALCYMSIDRASDTGNSYFQIIAHARTIRYLALRKNFLILISILVR